MVKLQIERDLAEEVIKCFLMLAKKSRGLKFSFGRNGRYSAIPKGVVVCEGSYCYVLDVFSPLLENVKGVIFDIVGLHEKFATLIEVYRDGNIIVSPSRPEEKVKEMLEALIHSA